MTDPIVQAQNELNEAVRARDETHTKIQGDDIASWARRRNADDRVAYATKRYNDLCIAYGKDE